MTSKLFFAVAIAFAASGCKCNRGSSDVLSKQQRPLSPLSAPSWLVELDVPGFGKAAVAVPLGSTEPRPILIALHGAADRPEWQCGTWAGIAGSHPFVLCPRGVKRDDVPDAPRFGWGAPADTEKELRAALRALKARFGLHIAPGPVVLAAFDTGVEHAVAVARQEPAFFTRLALVGVGVDDWSSGIAGAYVARGGQRVMFVCSEAACKEQAERYVVVTRGAGAHTKLVDAGDHGRLLDPPVAAAIKHEFSWLIAEDPRYPGSARAKSDTSAAPAVSQEKKP